MRIQGSFASQDSKRHQGLLKGTGAKKDNSACWPHPRCSKAKAPCRANAPYALMATPKFHHTWNPKPIAWVDGSQNWLNSSRWALCSLVALEKSLHKWAPPADYPGNQHQFWAMFNGSLNQRTWRPGTKHVEAKHGPNLFKQPGQKS